jgi:hypothetical protein
MLSAIPQTGLAASDEFEQFAQPHDAYASVVLCDAALGMLPCWWWSAS